MSKCRCPSAYVDGVKRFDPARYDAPAPWWFRNTLWMYLVFGLPIAYASGYRKGSLLVLLAVLLAAVGAAFFVWDRRHRVRE